MLLEASRKEKKKRRKQRYRFLIMFSVFITGIMLAVVVYVAFWFQKESSGKTPDQLLVEYMNYISKQEYEEMYAMLAIDASGNVSQDAFIKRNSAIYEGIEMKNMTVKVLSYDEEQRKVTYQTEFDTVAGTISFENEAFFQKGEDGYKIIWDASLIFPKLCSTDKVRVSTTEARRGEIRDRNGQVLAGAGVAASVGIVPGKLKNREKSISKFAELLEMDSETIEKKLSAKWVKEDSLVPIKIIPKVEENELLKLEPDKTVLKEHKRQEKLLALMVSMVEDVKGRGGSGYVVGKDKAVVEKWLEK